MPFWPMGFTAKSFSVTMSSRARASTMVSQSFCNTLSTNPCLQVSCTRDRSHCTIHYLASFSAPLNDLSVLEVTFTVWKRTSFQLGSTILPSLTTGSSGVRRCSFAAELLYCRRLTTIRTINGIAALPWNSLHLEIKAKVSASKTFWAYATGQCLIDTDVVPS